MNRLLIRRRSMSSIEEEDESIAYDESVPKIEKLTSSSSSLQQQSQFCRSPSILEWDSDLSESEPEFDDNNENLNDNSEEQAANRALQSFIQSCSRTHQTQMNDNNGSYSPFSIQLYDEEDPIELNTIISELRDFKIEFEENSSMNHYPLSSITTTKSSSSFSTDGCFSELRTLEDQLEAALASLTLTINDSSITNLDSQHHSSDSSACSSGLGEEISNESYHLYNISNTNHHTVSLTSKTTTTTTDDCDSAFSDSGSNDKITLQNPDESIIYRSMIPIIETPSIIDDSSLSHSSKILIRTYNDDNSTKSIFIDDSMLIRDILYVLIHKNHREADMNYVLIEILPDLHMERIFEDHQKLTEAILMWPTVSSNRLSFTKCLEKYNFFRTINSTNDYEYTPDIEGNIYLKEKSCKSWKKFFCVLRLSGIYFIPKGKSKKDLICLAKFENVELFFGFDWKKKYKSPTDFCFALKHPLIQKKSSKYIKYMCVDTKNDFDRWIINIRLAKFGQQLKNNYLLMDKAMNMYRLTGHFAPRTEPSNEQQKNDDLPIPDRQTPIPNTQYYAIHSPTSANNTDENSRIKSASYMDELRQRLEHVLNDSYNPIQSSLETKESLYQSTLIPSDNLHQIKSPIKTIGSTPLPRKQIQTFGNLSFRTINTNNNNNNHQQQMSKSFVIPSKREEDHQSLSINSKSNSLNLDHTNLSLSSSTFLNNTNKKTTLIKPKPTVTSNMNINRLKQSPTLKKSTTSFRTNTQPQSSLSIKTQLTPPPIKLSIPITQTSKQTNSTSINNKSVPPIPPRKSSISRPPLKPQPPPRNSSTNILIRKPYVSHL